MAKVPVISDGDANTELLGTGIALLICGSRYATDYCYVAEHLETLRQRLPRPIRLVLSGACPTGVDHLGERWAEECGLPVERFPADWERYGRVAGPIRNRVMIARADLVVAFPAEDSRGTTDTIRQARVVGKPCEIFPLPPG